MMKIKIRTKDFRMWLYLPTSLFFSRLGVSITLCATKKYVHWTEEQKEILIKGLRRCGKQYKGLTLVDVQTASGEKVLVTL
jgi:hypothetical protein